MSFTDQLSSNGSNNSSGIGIPPIQSYGLPLYTAIVLDTPRSQTATSAMRYYNLIVLPIIAVAGIFGNICSFLVMTSHRFRVFSYSQYLAGLAMFDMITLFAYTIPFLNYVSYPHFVVTYSSRLPCAIHEYVCMVNDTISSWFVIVITAERFAIVVWPFSARTIATPSFSRKVMAVLTVTVYCVYIYLLLVVDYRQHVIRKTCVIPTRWRSAHFQIATVITVYFPTFCILALNIILSIILRRSRGFGAGAAKAASTRKATVMVMTVSILFVIFTYPTASFMLISTLVKISPHSIMIGSSITGSLYAANSAINFYVYILAGDEVKHFVVEKLRKAVESIRRFSKS